MQKIETILFDFDGTLVEVNIDFNEMRRRVNSLGYEYGIMPKPDLYVLESIEDIFKTLSIEDESKARKFKNQAEELIVEIEIDAAGMSRMFPQVDETLIELRNRGIKIGIVTRNCKPAVLKSAEKAGFIYDLLLTRDDVEKVKPDPKHLLDALLILDTLPERAIMVGDHPMDILAGKRAGMKTAAVLTLKPKEDFDEIAPDMILENITDILKMI